MADIVIVEDRSEFPDSLQVNGQALVTELFHAKNLIMLKQCAQCTVFAQLIYFNKFYICNTFIVAEAGNLTAAEELVPVVDEECRKIRRELLIGRSLHADIHSKEHYFMTLHKDYTQRAYEYEGKPIGFHLRPVIFIEGSEQWDYFMGPTMRIDSIPLDAHALKIYLQRQVELVIDQKSRLLNMKKYYFWKSTSYFLKYGHYPIIGLWVAKLLTEIVQYPLRLRLPGLIALTTLFYGAIIGLAWIAHLYFKQSRFRELTSTKEGSLRPHPQLQPTQQEVRLVQQEMCNRRFHPSNRKKSTSRRNERQKHC